MLATPMWIETRRHKNSFGCGVMEILVFAGESMK